MIDPDGDEASAKLAIARPGPGPECGCAPSDLISRAAAVAAVECEPELPGPMPPDMSFIEREELCRSVVRETKHEIANRVRALPAAPAYADMPPSVRYVLTAITECYAHPIDTPERTEAWKRVCDLVAALAVDPVEAEYVAAVPMEVMLALRVIVEHVEPGWENCKTVASLWLEQMRAARSKGGA